MNDKLKQILRLQSGHDQDIERCKAWLREQDPECLYLLWRKIQATYPDPFTEAMTRMAQIGMTECMLRIEEDEQKEIEKQ